MAKLEKEWLPTLRPPVKWHGGKRYLARKIIDLFPQHRIYVEPFGGGASVLLNKPPSEIEVYNDLDMRITRLFRVLRDCGPAFIERLKLVLYSEAEFNEAAEYPFLASEMDAAVCDFIRWRQSFGGQGRSWSCSIRARGGMPGEVNAWWNAIDGLPDIIERLRRVQITARPAKDVIRRFDHPESVVYCDPPYVHETRSKGATEVYGVEMSDDDHIQLALLLRECRSRVLISGYPSGLYDELYSGWRRVDFDIANHAAGGKTKRRMTECVWMNF